MRGLWEAAETSREDRKRLIRCLIREVVLLRDDRPRATGGVTTIHISWCGGAWSEVRAHRPDSGELARTPQPVLERIRELAQHHADEAVAAILNTEGLQTKTGLAWTAQRVGMMRLRHGIPTACPLMPHGTAPRGDGRVSLEAVMAQVGVSRSVAASWCRSGFLAVEQGTPLGPHWIRLTDEDRARLDGTRAAHGSGRWRLREAQRVLGLSEEELYERIREGKLTAYRAHIGDHWEWRVDPADETQPEGLVLPASLQVAAEEV